MTRVAWSFCRAWRTTGEAAKFAREVRENERRSREKHKNRRFFKLLPPQSPRGFSALARLYYLARPSKTAMLRRLSSQGRIEEFLFRGGPTCAYEANNFQVLSLQTLGTKLVTNLFCYVHPQRHDTNGTHHILLVTTSSPVPFSLAFKVGREKARLTSKARQNRPGDEVVLVKDRALKQSCLVLSDKIAMSRFIQMQIKSHS